MTTRLERLRKICFALPEVAEVVTWDVHPTFRVRDKIFVIAAEDGTSITVKATKEDQAALVAAAPHITVAPYVGRHGWIRVDLAGKPDWTEVAELVTESWRLIAPKKLASTLQPGTRPGSR